MIIKRKLFTRQEAKAMKELYQALDKGNIGRNLSAKKFVNLRRAYNDSTRGIINQNNGNGINYVKNSKAIEDVGLPEMSKAYKRMMEKYTNPELRRRFERVQSTRPTSRLRVVRQKMKQENIDPLQIRQEYYKDQKKNYGTYGYDYRTYFNHRMGTIDDEYNKYYRDTLLRDLEGIKKERAGKNYRVDIKGPATEFRNEALRLLSKSKQIDNLARRGDNNTDPENAQKILKDLKKKGVRFVAEDPKSDYYSPSRDVINLKNKASHKSPATIGHEDGHRISKTRGELEGTSFYRYHENLDNYANTSSNLLESIKNKLGTMSTLMEEANASYHQAARANKYGITREAQKANNKDLSNSFRTYEINAANGINFDNGRRLVGELRSK